MNEDRVAQIIWKVWWEMSICRILTNLSKVWDISSESVDKDTW